MVEAYTLNVPCWIEIDDTRIGKSRTYRGLITEIYMNTKGVPYKFRLSYNNETRVIEPRILDGIMETNLKNKKVLRLLIDEDMVAE